MADGWTKRDTLLVVGICTGVAIVVGGYLLFVRHEKAKGLDFAERESAALSAARGIASDAELSRAEINFVNSAGHVELPQKPMGGRDKHDLGIRFFFRSPKLAGAPAQGQLGAPTWAGNGAGAGCSIEVDAFGPETRGRNDLRVRQHDGCTESMAAPLQCSLAQVWAAAIAKGAPRDALADIRLTQHDGKRRWDFTITDWNKSATPVFRATIDDACSP